MLDNKKKRKRFRKKIDTLKKKKSNERKTKEILLTNYRNIVSTEQRANAITIENRRRKRTDRTHIRICLGNTNAKNTLRTN